MQSLLVDANRTEILNNPSVQSGFYVTNAISIRNWDSTGTTDLSVGHDTAFCKSKPEPRICRVDLNRFKETVERLLEVATVQERYTHVVHENAVLVATQTLERPAGKISFIQICWNYTQTVHIWEYRSRKRKLGRVHCGLKLLRSTKWAPNYMYMIA